MTAPAATVIARRPPVGHVTIADVRCPWGHEHRVGLAASSSAELWCSYSARLYTVTLTDTEEQP